MTTEKQELSQLPNGRYIIDRDLSRKVFYAKEAKPERSHQISSTGCPWDGSDMAELFSECYRNDTRSCSEARCWYTYSKRVWRKDIGSLLVAEKIKEFCRLMAPYYGEVDNKDRRREYMKFIVRMGDRRFRDRLMKDVASVTPTMAEEFDANPFLINCLNGIYDMKKMGFHEYDWRDSLTTQTDFDYTLQDSRCERWERLITEVICNDLGKAEYLQKALGYSMLGMTNEECTFILRGKATRNGKPTMLSAAYYLLGDYAPASPVSIICKSDRSENVETANPMLASLKGKWLVTMAESSQYSKLDEETTKQLTGGGEIKTRNLYEITTIFLPQFTLWLSYNDLPSVNDKSLLASDRVRVVEFNRYFIEDEWDRDSESEFQTQETMRGIFTWPLGGYFKYKRFGLKVSSAACQVVKQYEKNNNLVLQFLKRRCEKAGDAYTRAKTLYDVYKTWCKSNGYFVCSVKRFNADMEAHPEWHGGEAIYSGCPTYRDIRMKGNV